ncbi:MAG TPA: tetratricopeptide repeat protein [Gemmataceae bacterium]|nr:tetratricopeptide repeat protein [Gemmataceae bacterium]
MLLALLVLPIAGVASIEGWSYRQERLARAALTEERFDDAQHNAEAALRIRPRSASVDLLAARIARQRGDFALAEQYLSLCQQHGGISEPLQLEWLLLRCQRGEVDALAPLLWGAVDRGHSESAAILETLAGAYIRQARYDEAQRALDRWIQLDPQSARALESRGWLHNQLDQREAAIADYERALELQPGRFAARLRLAEVLVASLQHAHALPHLERLRSQQPDNPAVLVLLAQCWAALSRLDEARALLDQVLAGNPDQFDALLQRGNLDNTTGNYADAERWLRRALEKSSGDPQARYSLYLSLEGQGNRQEEAKAELARWQEERKRRDRLTILLRTELPDHAGDPKLATEAGKLFLQIGETERGLFWLQRALAIDPRHAAAHQALLAYFEGIGDTAKAEGHRRLAAAPAQPRQ